MKKLLYITIIILISLNFNKASSQSMNNEELGKIIYVLADSLRGTAGNWQFVIKDRLLLCVTDENNNRMRIMSPIIEQKKLAYTDMLKVMEANFHTALDVKYAISNDLLWSVFIHPLQELSKEQVVDAIQQVYVAALTYGTTYNSTGLSFPDRRKEKLEEKKKKI
ncbi:MAG: hypothetical protein QNJ57_04315 [Flavobacteriaceae bacterium]|nr:hypothetical protein [Flavobacteriaceae bacterium]